MRTPAAQAQAMAFWPAHASRRCLARARRALTARGRGESTEVVTLLPVARR
jgi:hypothetical protein